ncbi:conserved protein of unknown function [Tenacibaculum sp. 190130A14a]|uniref:Lipoprotein n=1 Tax=Tenacibaculum polynesiense TaxID=3137857 RepID=A0ABM9PAX1_9FLAO
MKTSAISVLLVFLIIFLACEKVKKVSHEDVLVVNLKEETSKEKEVFLKLDLDKNHQNLLNPAVSKDSLKSVYQSWVKLHTDLNVFLGEKKFNWGLEKTQIKLFNKIYFNKEGRIKTYAFRVYDSISKEKADEFKKLIKDFAQEVKIKIKRENAFAQCGKISLPNN